MDAETLGYSLQGIVPGVPWLLVPEAADMGRAAEALLARAVASDPLRDRVDEEARALTDIENKFRIRHFETDRHPVGDNLDIDYLFVRLYALIRRLVLGFQGPA